MNTNGTSTFPKAPIIKSFGNSALGDLTRPLDLFDSSTCTVTLKRGQDTYMVAYLTAYGANGTAKPAGVQLKSKIKIRLEQASFNSTVKHEVLRKRLMAFARLGSYTTKSATTYRRLALCVLESLTKEAGRFRIEWCRGLHNLVHVTFGGFDYQLLDILREVKEAQPVLCDSLNQEDCVELQFSLENNAYEWAYHAPELESVERVDEDSDEASTTEELTSSVDGRADSAIIIGSPVQEKQQDGDQSTTASDNATSSVSTFSTQSSNVYTTAIESKPDEPTTTRGVSAAAEGKKRKRSDDDALEGAAGSAKVSRDNSYRVSDVIDSRSIYDSPNVPVADAATVQGTAGEAIGLMNTETRAPTLSTHAATTAPEIFSAPNVDLTSNSEEPRHDSGVLPAVRSAALGEASPGKSDGKIGLVDDAELFGEQRTGGVEGISLTAKTDKVSPDTLSVAFSRKRKAEDVGEQASKRRASEASRSETIQTAAADSISSTTQASRQVDGSNEKSKVRRKLKQRELSAPFKKCEVTFKWYEEDYTLKEDHALVAISADKKFLNLWQDAEEPTISIPTAAIKDLESAKNEEELVLSRDGEKALTLAINDEYLYSRTREKFYNELSPLANGGKGTDRLQKKRADEVARKTVNQTSRDATFMRQQWKAFGNNDWKNTTKSDMKQFCRWVDETHADQPFRGVSNLKKTQVQSRIIEWLTMNVNEGADAASAVPAARPRWPAHDENGRVLGYYHTNDEARAAMQEAIFSAASARQMRQQGRQRWAGHMRKSMKVESQAITM